MASLLLAVLLFRAYIPSGFMPAGGAPFLLELCPDASSMAVPMAKGHVHHHPAQSHTHFQHCPFGSAPASGPVTQPIAFEPAARIAAGSIPPVEPIRLTAHRLRTHQPRGPPSVS